jgi:hypothetical protein
MTAIANVVPVVVASEIGSECPKGFLPTTRKEDFSEPPSNGRC